MAGRNEPDLTYNKGRKLTEGKNASIFEGFRPDQFTDFVNSVRGSDSLYQNLNKPNTKGLAGVLDDDDTISDSTQVLVDLTGVLSKSRFLKDMVDSTQSKQELFIPVNDQEIKKAVSRVFPGTSSGYDKIFWPMWKAVVENKVRQSELIGSEFLETLTGNASDDAKVLDDTIKAFELSLIRGSVNVSINVGNIGGFSIPDRGATIKVVQSSNNLEVLKEILSYGAALISLYFLNRKLAVFKAPESQQIAISSTTFPNPSGAVLMIIQIIIGLAMHFLIEGLLEDDVENVLRGMDIPGVDDGQKDEMIQSAKILASGGTPTKGPLAGKNLKHPDVKAMLGFKDGMLDVAKAFYFRADYDLIYEYGMNWLSTVGLSFQTKNDFSQWLLYGDILSTEYELENNLQEAASYSAEFLKNEKKGGGTRTEAGPISNNIDKEYAIFRDSQRRPFVAFNKDDLKERLFRDKHNDMLGALLGSFQDQACEYNDNMNKLAGFLTNNPVITKAVCCFVRYFGAIDIKILAGLRSLMQIFAKGIVFDLGAYLNQINANVYDDLLTKAKARLTSSLNDIFAEIVADLSDWMGSEQLDLLAECLPIDAMLKFALSSVEDMHANLNGLIADLLARIQIQTMSIDSKISILHEQKWARNLYLILDSVITLLQESNTCVITGNPSEDDSTQILLDTILEDPYYRGLKGSSKFASDLIRSGEIVSSSDADNSIQKESLDADEYIDPDSTEILTTNVRYNPGVVTDELKDLMSSPSEFNIFSSISPFYTEHGLPIQGIRDNIRERNSSEISNKSVLSEEDLSTCFEGIDQTNLLKSILRNVRNE